MPLEWKFASDHIRFGASKQIPEGAAMRQERTATEILHRLNTQPGVILADEVGMGKTFVALAVAASVLATETRRSGPVIVLLPQVLVSKWRREWGVFLRRNLAQNSSLARTQLSEVRKSDDLLSALDRNESRKPQIILMSVGALTARLTNRWAKLALIREQLRHTRLSARQRDWVVGAAGSMCQMNSQNAVADGTIGLLMRRDISEWQAVLTREGVLETDCASPISSSVARFAREAEATSLQEALQDPSLYYQQLEKSCQAAYSAWLPKAFRRAPLLILDEAHHAKNSRTRLAGMFQSAESRSSTIKGTFFDTVDRMLLLTATPFQLGHNELTRVLSVFGAVKWSDNRAPANSRSEFATALQTLEERLDANRLAAKALDKAWSRLTPERIAQRASISDTSGRKELPTLKWFRAAERAMCDGEANSDEVEILTAYASCLETRTTAARDVACPWASLSTWVIRHNLPTTLDVVSQDGTQIARREICVGRAVAEPEGALADGSGLSFGKADALPFLLAARAQGEMAGKRRARSPKFTEGLCSSFEAFHHTRSSGDEAIDDERSDVRRTPATDGTATLIPLAWYAEKIALHVPGLSKDDSRARTHPKLGPVVARVVDLWERGEKSLLICFYLQTSSALAEHIEHALHQRVSELSMRLTGADTPNEGRKRFESIVKRVGNKKSPFYRMMRAELQEVVDDPKWENLARVRDQVVEQLLAYARSATFLVRILSPEGATLAATFADDPEREHRDTNVEIFRQALRESKPGSSLSLVKLATSFCEYVNDLAETKVVAAADFESDGEEHDPLEDYLNAISRHSKRDRDDDDAGFRTRYSANRPVRLVNGQTPSDARDRVMLAFNSPMFPEILVSTKVLAEGVDLHQFCRYVFHHDLDWNPSVLEQRTGRVDRLRCRAEKIGQPIVVYEPFIAGSADEKMYRVVRDRERWFQIVMGQKYEFDEGMAEDIAERVPLPAELSQRLVFDLAVAEDTQ